MKKTHTIETTQKQVSDTAQREEDVLAFWKAQGIFEKSLSKEAPNGEFVFYDGPPFATGLPHWGSLLSSISKDVFGRYKTMCGYRVPRRWGWDCHGLPIENMIEKKLDLKSKKDIEAMGIDRFNEEARSAVLQYADEWKRYVDRVGRWVDFDHSYKTMDNTYIESVWWALKKIHTDKRLYEGRKVLMYCPRCETPLSKAEIAMDNSYKDVTDEAVFVKFKVKEVKRLEFGVEGPIYILAWTTTPWTLPGNVALAVGKDVEYVAVQIPKFVDSAREDGAGASEVVFGDTYIVASSRVDGLLNDIKPKVVKRFRGSDLVSLSYEPLYDIPKAKALGGEKAWTIQGGDFVTTEDGTGVVHIAPMYGEEDYKLGLEHDLPIVPLLDATGIYNADAPELVRGMYFKKGGKYVMEDLETRGLLFAKHPHKHSYPHCYRCGTALIYNALTSWFIDIQSVKKRLLEANENISWHPEHLKHGRFQHIVEGAPDWTISRNRFWASPLPIWKHEGTDEVSVIGSLAELRERTKKSGNTYYMIRHGEAESNVAHTISNHIENAHHLTPKGRTQIEHAIATLKERGITKIIASPILRTKETAEQIVEGLGIPVSDILYDERLMEWQLGALDGKPVATLKDVCPTYEDRFVRGCGTGETLVEMKQRIGSALYAYEEQYANERILLVGHEYTLWLAECVAQGASLEECIAIRGEEEDYVANGEIRTLEFVPLPHNRDYELDLHRPYIDNLPLVASDGSRLVRIPEVVDCWVESGSMPFASEHYPHENEEVVKRRYPGDFIAEYIAQTRTWFYYMHAMGVLLFNAPSFKHCLTTGTLLAEDGAKISKSKKNYTDPLDDMDVYGADAGRLYVMGSVVMSAEDLAFNVQDLRDVHNRFIGTLWNTYKFYEMYAGERVQSVMKNVQSTNLLDKWILTRLAQVVREVTVYMDAYDTVRSVRALRDFVSDLSTWYIRRSRDRFKSDDVEDRECAITTTAYVLRTFATLCAPIAPFIAEQVYRGAGGEKESVHLAGWPALDDTASATDLLEDMVELRRLVSLALEARQRAGVKVRQPLASLTLAPQSLQGKHELLAILADEVNVKSVQFGSGFEGEVLLDTTITPELKQEGDVRELIRAVQDLRKQAGLNPEDKATLVVEADEIGSVLVESARLELARVAGVAEIVYETGVVGTKVKVEGGVVVVALQ
jgi:isoleucyl-tRNA synthetase